MDWSFLENLDWAAVISLIVSLILGIYNIFKGQKA